jgi:hypothetical protein
MARSAGLEKEVLEAIAKPYFLVTLKGAKGLDNGND